MFSPRGCSAPPVTGSLFSLGPYAQIDTWPVSHPAHPWDEEMGQLDLKISKIEGSQAGIIELTLDSSTMVAVPALRGSGPFTKERPQPFGQ